MHKHFRPSEPVSIGITSIVVNPVGHDLAFALVQELEALVSILGEVNHPEVCDEANDACDDSLDQEHPIGGYRQRLCYPCI